MGKFQEHNRVSQNLVQSKRFGFEVEADVHKTSFFIFYSAVRILEKRFLSSQKACLYTFLISCLSICIANFL